MFMESNKNWWLCHTIKQLQCFCGCIKTLVLTIEKTKFFYQLYQPSKRKLVVFSIIQFVPLEPDKYSGSSQMYQTNQKHKYYK